MVKVMISLPEELLARIDQAARRRGTTRSAFLQDAARGALGQPDPAAFDEALARSRRRFAESPGFDPAAVIRADRDRRSARDRDRL